MYHFLCTNFHASSILTKRFWIAHNWWQYLTLLQTLELDTFCSVVDNLTDGPLLVLKGILPWQQASENADIWKVAPCRSLPDENKWTEIKWVSPSIEFNKSDIHYTDIHQTWSPSCYLSNKSATEHRKFSSQKFAAVSGIATNHMQFSTSL